MNSSLFFIIKNLKVHLFNIGNLFTIRLKKCNIHIQIIHYKFNKRSSVFPDEGIVVELCRRKT